MRKFWWSILVTAALLVTAGLCTPAAGGRVVLLEQATNVGCG